MVLRGRSLRGELDPMAVLTEGQVHQIRHRLAAGEFHRTIAASYGVCRETVTMINLGRLWGWLKTEGLQGS